MTCPSPEDFLIVRSPGEGTKWLMGNNYFVWNQEPPVGRELFEVERGEVAWWITAYLTRGQDTQAFLDWAMARAFVNAGVEDVAEVYDVFVGEHGWAPAADYTQVPLGTMFEEARPSRNAPVRLEAVATKYPFPAGGRDESVSATEWLHLPDQKIVQIGGLRWSGQGADYLDPEGNRAAFDPSAHAAGAKRVARGGGVCERTYEPAQPWLGLDRCVREVREISGSGAGLPAP